MRVAEAVSRIRNEISKAVIGQDDVISQILVAFVADGHVLLEGVPGVAKTLIVRSVSQALGLQFSRIQFTPDLMPTDVVGTNIFNPKLTEFELRKGPIFTNVLLADEINRTPPKTQAALLEAMEERQVTIDGHRMVLPQPFVVFATQNPIEFEGTYPLPEAQQDRFLLKIHVEYPEPHEETEMLRRYAAGFRSQHLEEAGIQQVVQADELMAMRQEVQSVLIDDKVFEYVYRIVAGTRDHSDIQIGASPRAGLALIGCAKASAAIKMRDFVIPDDVKEFVVPALRHRVLLRADVDTQGVTVDEILQDYIATIPVPR